MDVEVAFSFTQKSVDEVSEYLKTTFRKWYVKHLKVIE